MDPPLLQRFSRVERVTGIEPALSAWEPTWYGQSAAADRLIERGVDNRLSPRLAVSRRTIGHAEGTPRRSRLPHLYGVRASSSRTTSEGVANRR